MKIRTCAAGLGLVLALTSTSALASPQRCIGLKPDAARLACFDAEIKLQPVVISSASAARAGNCPAVESANTAVPMVIQVQPGMGPSNEPTPRVKERHR